MSNLKIKKTVFPDESFGNFDLWLEYIKMSLRQIKNK